MFLKCLSWILFMKKIIVWTELPELFIYEIIANSFILLYKYYFCTGGSFLDSILTSLIETCILITLFRWL